VPRRGADLLGDNILTFWRHKKMAKRLSWLAAEATQIQKRNQWQIFKIRVINH